MRVGNLRALAVCLLFVRFVVTVIGVDDVEEFADLVFQMRGLSLCIVEMGICKNVVSILSARGTIRSVAGLGGPRKDSSRWSISCSTLSLNLCMLTAVFRGRNY